MGLFKSRREREIDRELEIRRGVNLITRMIRDLERHENEYLAKARKAKQYGDKAQYEFLKQTIKRTAAQRLLMERQLLSIETARQLHKQAEVHAQFAAAMTAISKGIGDFFGRTDLKRTQSAFTRALAQAKDMEGRMEVFLDMTGEAVGAAGAPGDTISDEEIDRMVEREIAASESPDVDAAITDGLREVKRELGEK